MRGVARRSATNPRYRKEAQIGSTRRSSASLKPKRASGAPSASAKPKGAGPAKAAYVDPPEVKKWRRLWAVLLGIALVPVAYVLGPNVLKWLGAGSGWPVNQAVAKWGLYFEMAALAGALYIDYAIIRKIQRAAREGQRPGKKADRSEKDAT